MQGSSTSGRQLLAPVLSLTLVAVLLSSTGVMAAGHFSDVPTDHPFAEEIGWLVSEGVTTGFDDGTFRPTVAVSRQAAAAFLYRLAGEPPVAGVAGFSDVPTNHRFHDEIAWMVDQEITTGYSDGTFRPTVAVSRQAIAAFLYRLADEPTVTRQAGFPDVPTGHPFHDEIAWLVDQQITTGYSDGTFRPTVAVSRQAAAAFLHRHTTGTPPGPDPDPVPDPAPGDCEAPPILLERSGSIDTPGAVNAYSLQLVEGQRVSFEMISFSTNMAWRLVGPAPLGTIFDRTNPRGNQLVTAERTGTYTLELYGSSTNTGTYQFRIHDVTDPTCLAELSFDRSVTPPRIDVGEGIPVEGAGLIAVPGEYHRFTLQLVEGQRVSFEMISFSTNMAWRLVGPAPLGTIFDRTNPRGNQLVTAERTGTYTLELYGSSPITGTYNFRIHDVTDPTVSSALTFDRSVTPPRIDVGEGIPVEGAGLIAVPGEYHRFTLQLVEGQRVSFEMISFSTNMAWRLVGPAPLGTIFDRTNPRGNQLVTAERTGTYTLELYGSSPITGTYNFRIHDVTGA